MSLLLDLLADPDLAEELLTHCWESLPDACLAALRQTCRAARDAVDASVYKTVVKTNPSKTLRILPRWSRVQSITLSNPGTNGITGPPLAADAARLLALGSVQPPSSSQGDAPAEENANHSWLHRLQELKVECWALRQAQAAVLLRAPWWQQLRTLSLEGVNVSKPQQLYALLRKCRPQLQQLVLKDVDPIGSKELVSLAGVLKGGWPALESLTWHKYHSYEVGRAEAKALAASCPKLTELSLGETVLPTAMVTLRRAPWRAQLRKATFAMMACSDVHEFALNAPALATFAGAAWPCLEELHLHNCHFNESSLGALAAADLPALHALTLAVPMYIPGATLTYGEDGDLKALEGAAWWPQLEQLVVLTTDTEEALRLVQVAPAELCGLHVGKLDDEGLAALAQAPCRPVVQKINLDYQSTDPLRAHQGFPGAAGWP